jgi:hypothetical protein
MTDTITATAAAVRKLSEMLRALADDIDAGHAKYVSGNFNFQIDPADGLDDIGSAPLTGKLPHGRLLIEADATFLTGQP